MFQSSETCAGEACISNAKTLSLKFPHTKNDFPFSKTVFVSQRHFGDYVIIGFHLFAVNSFKYK